MAFSIRWLSDSIWDKSRDADVIRDWGSSSWRGCSDLTAGGAAGGVAMVRREHSWAKRELIKVFKVVKKEGEVEESIGWLNIGNYCFE